MFLTVVVFRYVRTSPNHEVATPVAAFVAANSDSPKTLMDPKLNFNEHLYQVWVKDLFVILPRLVEVKQV